ncbi:hypothetical protein [Actinokineospora globicatena]|uniref:hypothetical protein n=1 Tax=Actinokineospora globicatena TaxID=103729 RepID=UPI0020A25742|nr:hypothetical protein [Actinokineospora globicatena]MCP2302823.1 hypothetical protein [Actinokineospora globicatena]GLW84538.1 hypothetical protein Aglo02_21780 [Actinokineospora globicatena]
MAQLGRRGFLAGVGAAALVVGVGTVPAAASTDRWGARNSANGWPIRSKGITEVRVEGSAAVMTVLGGDVAALLGHVARRFHYEIAELGPGDIQGHTADRRVAAPLESNYLSGTAIALLPTRFPLGATGGLFPHEIAVLRDILADCSATIRWGGDDPVTPKEGHFELDATPAAAAKAARTLAAAGAIPDPFVPTRRSRALALERHQRRR